MFIYVMDEESKNILCEQGYILIKSADNVWVFQNKDEQTFDAIDVPCVMSDMLTF